MKVLIFIRSLDTGGSQRQLAMLANGLARRSHQVTIVVLYPGGAIQAAMQDTGVRLISIGKAGRWDVMTPLARLWRLLRSERPDVIYTFQPTQSVIAAFVLPPWRPARLVFGIRAGRMEFDRYDALSAVSYRLEAWLSRRADLMIANGRAVKSDAVARGLPSDRIAVIPNGIDTAAMRPDPMLGRELRRTWGVSETAFVIGMVARLDPMKDHETFLAAAARFARQDAGARFVCVGDGPQAYRDELAASARSLGIDDRVVWAGELERVEAAYNAFDIATLSSAFGEGFPNVVGEAMACGRPVVATDVGESRFVIGDYGAAVPPRRPDLLNDAWVRVRQRVENDASLRTSARTRIVEQFSADVMVDRSEKVLAAVCAGRTASAICEEIC
jgi:glycosyltransferase involved in cell wall biosynthesis